MANTYKRLAFGTASSESGRVKVSVDDAILNYLEEKIDVGSDKLVKSVLNPGTIETLILDVDDTKIDHDQLLNFEEIEHKQLDDAQTTLDTLWSSQKIQDELDTKVDKIVSTDNAIAKFDGINGDIQDTAILIDDLNNVTGVNDLTIEGNLLVKGDTTTVNTSTLDVEDANITVNKNGNQATADLEQSGLTVEMSDATDAILGYNSTTSSKFVAGEVGSESEIITKDHAQELLNKTIDATAATGTNIITMDSDDVLYNDTLSGLGASNVKDALDIIDQNIEDHINSTTAHTSANIVFDNSINGFSSTDAQSAIEEVNSNLNDHINSTSAHTAVNISFDNSINGFVSVNTQDAIEEVKQTISDLNTVTNEPTGFPNRNDSIVTFDDLTATLTIAPTGASFDIYVKGEKFTKTIAESIALNTAESENHYFYYDSNGDLQVTHIFFPEIFSENAIVAVVYWNTDLQEHVYFGEERHGLQMDGATHGYLHTTFGARYISGLALQNFDEINFFPGLDVDSGSIRDEDILLQIAASTTPTIGLMYRQGTQWKKITNPSHPLLTTGSTVDYLGFRVPYNNFNTGTQQWELLDPGSDNRYILVHYFATNDKDTPIVAIQGTSFYGDAPSAKNAAVEEIKLLSGLPFLEFVAIGTVVYKTSLSFSGDVPRSYAEYVQIDPGVNYVDFRGTQQYVPSGTATSHSILSGLSNDDHFQYHTDARADAWYANKFPYDILETEYTLLDNQASFIAIPGLIIDTNSYSFTAYVNVERGNSSEFVIIRSNYNNGISDWNTTIESTGIYTEVDFDVQNDNIMYKTSNNGNNAVIRIKVEGLGTSGA